MTKRKNSQKISSIKDLFDAIEAAKAELDFEPGEECFYRGETRSSYDLVPSLFRTDYDDEEDVRATESSLYYEFSTRARIAHANVSDWDFLFYMRHHGVPTRLIDWTETVGVALYFATLAIKQEETPCLWILNPYLLNDITWEVRDLINPEYLLNPYEQDRPDYTYQDFLEDPLSFEIKWPVAIYPRQKSDRMLAQRGWFTFHGYDRRALNKIGKLKKCWRRIEIPVSLVPDIRLFLDRAGINDYTMFPDLDGLSRYLKMKYEFEKR